MVFQQHLFKDICLLHSKSLSDTPALEETKLPFLELCLFRDITKNMRGPVIPPWSSLTGLQGVCVFSSSRTLKAGPIRRDRESEKIELSSCLQFVQTCWQNQELVAYCAVKLIADFIVAVVEIIEIQSWLETPSLKNIKALAMDIVN